MKLLIVSALFCAMMALTTAAALPAKEASNDTEVLLLTALEDEEAGSGMDSLLLPGEPHYMKPTKQCPHGWTEYSKRCFIYVFHAMSWAQAQRNCDFMKANLASVHTFEEYQFVQHLIFNSTHASQQTWLGGSDAQENGYWFWIDGTPFRYTNWCPGQPSNYCYEQCLQMNFGGHKCWDDAYCTNLKPSICAKNI